MNDIDKINVIPPHIMKHITVWNFWAGFHRILHVVLGMTGILCPLVVATFADQLPQLGVRILSLCAAVSVAVFSAYEIGQQATKFREAWKHLNAASFRYLHGLINIEALIDSYCEGEKMIGQLNPDPFKKMIGQLNSDPFKNENKQVDQIGSPPTKP